MELTNDKESVSAGRLVDSGDGSCHDDSEQPHELYRNEGVHAVEKAFPSRNSSVNMIDIGIGFIEIAV